MPDRAAFSGPLHFLPSLVYLRSLEKCRLAQGPLLTFVSKHLSRRIVFASGMGCLMLSLFAMVLPAGHLTYLGAALFALGNGLSWPTFQARVSEVAGDSQGTIQGAATSASSLAAISGLVVGGVLYPAMQGGLFYVAAALFAVVLVLTPIWFPSGNKAERVTT